VHECFSTNLVEARLCQTREAMGWNRDLASDGGSL
jgi:hypothetical protein